LFVKMVGICFDEANKMSHFTISVTLTLTEYDIQDVLDAVGT